jgi:phosphatidate cytidylyltransferase
VTEKNKNLIVRLVSALALLPIVLTGIAWGGWWAGAVFSFAAAACAWEYQQIVFKQTNGLTWFVVGCAGLLPFLPVALPSDSAAGVIAVTGVVVFTGWIWHLLRGPLADAPVRTAHVLMAFFYGAGGMTAVSQLRNAPDGGWWVVAALVITWGNDTSAYFAGRFLGKHKLYPEVSPNKTWEGFFGGFAGAIGFLFVQKVFFFPALTVADCLVLGSLGSLLGPAGDLCESMLKRAYGVKDSGKIIPGHGGMLDRIDALIFNAPMVLLYVTFGRGLLMKLS